MFIHKTCHKSFILLQDFKHLELKCETQEEADSWKASFFRAKVILENSQNTSELFVDKVKYYILINVIDKPKCSIVYHVRDLVRLQSLCKQI